MNNIGGLTLAIVLVWSSLLMRTSGTQVTRAHPSDAHQTAPPWLSPCAGQMDVLSTDFPIQLSDAPRSPELDDPLLFAAQMRRLLASTTRAVQRIQNYMIEHHFGHNSTHASALADQPTLSDFDLDLDEIAYLDELTLAQLYERFMRAAMYVEMLRSDLEEQRQTSHAFGEEELQQALRVLAHGGWDGQWRNEAGIYQLLCKMFTFRSANGHSPIPEPSVNILHSLLHPLDKASRHNRDFTVLLNIQRLLDQTRDLLQPSTNNLGRDKRPLKEQPNNLRDLGSRPSEGPTGDRFGPEKPEHRIPKFPSARQDSDEKY